MRSKQAINYIISRFSPRVDPHQNIFIVKHGDGSQEDCP